MGMLFLNGLILYVCIRLVLYVYAGASNAISRELLREAGMSKGFVVMFWQLVFICCYTLFCRGGMALIFVFWTLRFQFMHFPRVIAIT